jgi:pyruvate dehydrogenase E1 component beta subunit
LHYSPSGGHAADVTVVTYGGTTPIVEQSMASLIEQDELRFDYFVLTQLWPHRLDKVIESARRSGRLVVVEESNPEFGVAASVIAEVIQQSPGVRCRAVGSLPLPFPAVRHLEEKVLPTEARIMAAIREVCGD